MLDPVLQRYFSTSGCWNVWRGGQREVRSVCKSCILAMALFTPRKCGVKFDPPALILYYLVNATGIQRFFYSASNVEICISAFKLSV